MGQSKSATLGLPVRRSGVNAIFLPRSPVLVAFSVTGTSGSNPSFLQRKSANHRAWCLALYLINSVRFVLSSIEIS